MHAEQKMEINGNIRIFSMHDEEKGMNKVNRWHGHKILIKSN
jgi:hypothetical protein